MNPVDAHNPYAPPKADPDAPRPQVFQAARPAVDLPEALRRLNAHVADPRNLEQDRRAAGARFRPVGWVLFGIGAVSTLVMGTSAVSATSAEGVLIAGSVFGGILAVIGLVVLAVDLSLARRDVPSSPEKTLKTFFKAIPMGRFGYSWAMLCPTAREQTVGSPSLAPVDTVPGAFSLAGVAEMKAYLSSFARSSGAVMRSMGIKGVVLDSVEGDVARVDITLAFQSWPRWVSVVAVLGFVILRPLVIIGAVAFFVTRKRQTLRVRKVLIRASTGVWYVYDGDALEGAGAV
jgi:hypothetical protein